MPGRNGGTLFAGAGRGPKKGTPMAGRPPDQWKRHLQQLADRDEVLAHVDAALLAGPRRPKLDAEGNEIPIFATGKDGRQFLAGVEMTGSDRWEWAMEYVTDHGYGRATQPIDHTGTIVIADKIRAARERASQR